VRDPDHAGRAGRAWLVGRPDDDHVDTTAAVATYLLSVPGAHPFWSWWVLSVVHLRDIPGQSKPPTRRYPEAEHELLIAALDPGTQPDPGDPTTFRYMTPIDVCEQFHGLDDDGALTLARLSVLSICRGDASPDQDWRPWWRTAIPNTVQHIALGSHPRAKA